jgi:predicted RNA methylase
MTKIPMDLALNALEEYLKSKSQLDLDKFWNLYPNPIPSWHITMMNDLTRNEFYKSEIILKCKDKIVMDLGCGAGLLTQYALEAGAKHIYALDQDPILQKCFEQTFKQEIANGHVTFLAKCSLELTDDDFAVGKPDVVMHEIFGRSLFDERVMETFTELFANEIINVNMDFIPQKFSLFACLHNQPIEAKINDRKYSDKFWFLESISNFGTRTINAEELTHDSEDLSPDFEIFSVDLKNIPKKLESNISTEAKSDGNLLRIWFELYGNKSKLTSDIKINPNNHWGNSKYFLKFNKGLVNLNISYSDKGGKLFTFIKS